MHYSRNGVYQNKSAYIDSLCKAFDLAPGTQFSSFNKSVKVKKEKQPTTNLPKKEPCQKCAKIRSSVKKFFRAKFETENTNTGTTKTSPTEKQIRMHIFKDDTDHVPIVESINTNHIAVFESHPIANTTVCFGCDDQPKREPSIRGPPIISPVCNGNISASPLGEVFKNLPERVKKVIKIDRPRSLGPRNRMVDKEQPRETSVHETKKPRGQ